jgi:site-specific recombinase XerD
MFISAYRDGLRGSVLRHSADAYVGYLKHHQYCPATIRAYLHSIEHFARWVSGLHIPLSAIDESLTHRFVTEHLSVCRCPAPCQCSINSVRPALAHLLHVLREEGSLSGPRSFSPLVQEELERFDIHLDSVCGVAENTRVSRRQWVGKFLTDHFGSAPVDIPRIHSSDIVEFIVRPTNHYRTGTLGVLGSALRSYLRFRAVSCGDKVEALLAAVPTVAKWRLDTVPKHLTTDEVAGLLGAIDQHNPIGGVTMLWRVVSWIWDCGSVR